MLALVYGLNQNYNLLSGRKFTVLTDHQALTHLFTQKQTNPLINNWLETILSFNFTLLHIPGRNNFIPDLLSRNPVIQVNQISTEMTEKEITDKLTALHLQGHFQANQMIKQLKQSKINIPGAKEKCKKIAKSCIVCQKYNPASPAYQSLTSIDAKQPFDHVIIDLVTDLPKSEENFVHVLVVSDVFSKCTFLTPITDKSANCIAKAFTWIIANHGIQKIIQSDQGNEFCNSIVENLCLLLGIDKRVSVAYSPRTNGLVERTNQTWTRIIKKLADSTPNLWPHYLPATQMFLNNRIPESLPITSFEAYFGRRNNTFADYSTAKVLEITDEEMIEKIRFIKEFLWPQAAEFSVSCH